jgi:hypothetical protein
MRIDEGIDRRYATGDACVDHLVGDFSPAICGRLARAVFFLARDFMGIRRRRRYATAERPAARSDRRRVPGALKSRRCVVPHRGE